MVKKNLIESLVFHFALRYAYYMNPFKAHREKMGLSLDECARQLDTTKETLINLEAGRYVRPPDWITDWFVRRGAHYLELTNGYEEFVAETRRKNHRFLKDMPLEVWTEPYFNSSLIPSNPFTAWREIHGLSIQEVSKRLCISKDSLRYFEQKRGRHQQSVPKALLEALKQCGYSANELNTLKTAYKTYLERVR